MFFAGTWETGPAFLTYEKLGIFKKCVDPALLQDITRSVSIIVIQGRFLPVQF